MRTQLISLLNKFLGSLRTFGLPRSSWGHSTIWFLLGEPFIERMLVEGTQNFNSGIYSGWRYIEYLSKAAPSQVLTATLLKIGDQSGTNFDIAPYLLRGSASIRGCLPLLSLLIGRGDSFSLTCARTVWIERWLRLSRQETEELRVARRLFKERSNALEENIRLLSQGERNAASGQISTRLPSAKSPYDLLKNMESQGDALSSLRNCLLKSGYLLSEYLDLWPREPMDMAVSAPSGTAQFHCTAYGPWLRPAIRDDAFAQLLDLSTSADAPVELRSFSRMIVQHPFLANQTE